MEHVHMGLIAVPVHYSMWVQYSTGILIRNPIFDVL